MHIILIRFVFGERGLKDHINISFIYNFMCIAQINQGATHLLIFTFIISSILLIGTPQTQILQNNFS